jgi:hypothetical protein
MRNELYQISRLHLQLSVCGKSLIYLSTASLIMDRLNLFDTMLEKKKFVVSCGLIVRRFVLLQNLCLI